MRASFRLPLFLSATLLFSGTATAQSSAAYAFSAATNGSMVDLSSGSTVLLGAAADDSAAPVRSIGFDFHFMGSRYTQYSVSSNGFVRLGGAVIGGSVYTLGAAGTPLIAAYGSDLMTSGLGQVRSRVDGAAPNRTLTIEFRNMVIIYDPAGGPNGIYQVILHETTGRIEFRYGPMFRNGGSGRGGAMNPQYVGFSVDGADDAFATVLTSTGAVNTTGALAANQPPPGPIANLDSIAEGSRTVYTFTPPVPAAPSALAFSGVSPTGMTLEWTDSPDELSYVVHRSTDGGVTFAFHGTASQNATSYPVTGLLPATTYHWRVQAVSEGALSAALSGSQATGAGGNVTSTVTGGNWSDPLTWSGGVVPTAADNVTIAEGATVLIDTDAVALSVQVGAGGNPATLGWDTATARTLTVGGDVTVALFGLFWGPTSGSVTTHNLLLAGDLTVNGTFDFSTNGNGAGATLTFTGEADAAVSGFGTVDVRQITVNKGTTPAAVVTLAPAAFTVRGVTTDTVPGGWLVMANGTLRVAGTFPLTSRVFAAAAYVIPASFGFWLDNPNVTVAGQNASPTNNGVLRVTQGTYNIGTGSGNSMSGGAGAAFVLEGGAVNVSGRLNLGNAVTYAQSGGTLRVSAVGNGASNAPSFGITSSSSTVNVSGGRIVLVQACTGATPVDYFVGTGTFTGGTLQIGEGGTATNFLFRIAGQIPSLEIDAATNPKSVRLLQQTNLWLGNLAVPAGSAFTLNGYRFNHYGGNVTNDGVIDASAPGSRFDFRGLAAQTYSGTGTFGTAAAPALAVVVSNPAGLTLDAPVVTLGAYLMRGNITNANRFTLGVGGTSGATVQISTAGATTAGGSFDVSPTWNLGTAGQTLYLLQEPSMRTTGFEVNTARVLTNLEVANSNDVTLAGGDLTVSGTLTLTSGRVITGANVLAVSDAGSVARTGGRVDGNLRKTFPAAGTRAFEVGTANGYSPVDLNATAGTFPAVVTVKATEAAAPSFPAGLGITRHWTLTATGITADLTFRYLDADIPGTVTESQLHVFRNDGGTFADLGGVLDTGLNTASVSGISAFSDWTLGMVPPATATVSGGATICQGSSTTIQAVLTGTAPWDLVWSDGFTQNGVATSPATRAVSPGATTTYTVTSVSDANGPGSASGSAEVTVSPDGTPPVVTAPADVTIDQTLCCGAFGGISSATSASLATFLAAATATDDCVAAPSAMAPQIIGVDVTSTTCFEAGATSVTFRFEDAATNVGTANATVTVRMFGDLNLDALVDGSDYVILRDYLNFVASPGVPPFNAPLGLADLNHDATVDPGDFVMIRDYMNFVTPCLAP